MIAARLYGPGDIRIEELPEPAPGPGEVLIRVRAVGVCASDLHFYRLGEIGGWGFDEPALLGHECSGEVVAFGTSTGDSLPTADATGGFNLQVGSRVAIEPTRPCGVCDLCLSGHYNICRSLRFAGQPPEPGAFCEYITAPLDRVFPLPDGVGFGGGAMVEPAAVAVHAVRLAGVQPGQYVGILGAGAIGLSLLQVCAAYGAHPIISEPLPSRRELAGRLGASVVIDPHSEDPREVVQAVTEGRGVEVAFEASGTPDGPAQASSWVGYGGTLSLVGIPDEDELVLQASIVRRREIIIRTVRRYCGEFPESLDLIAAGKLNAGAFITHRFSLKETDRAFAAAATHPDAVVRALVEIPDSKG